ncbi:MAG: HAD family hydrolase, partial [Acidobacteriota bacterium]|nr:HAD family hydrolase [Acidobacteriota bacterium]
MRAVLAAVLFDWGDTLMRWAWEPELLSEGHDAGLRAIGRAPVPALTERFRASYLPLLLSPGTLEEVEYPALVRGLLAEEGIEVSDADLLRFLEAEHAAWRPARLLAPTTHALLEALRDRGLGVGLVSNAVDPPDLLHHDLEQMGVARRLDVAVFSSEVGWRKPHPAIFERALAALGADPAQTLFVGDTLGTDVAGAAALGMHTCQALWFRADEDER